MRRTSTPRADRRLVQGTGWLERLSDARLAALTRLGTPTRVPAGQVLTEEGRPGREAFVILRGRARVTVAGEVVARLGPGNFAGEMALLYRQPRSATVVAETPMELLVFDPRSFSALLEQPAPAARLSEELAAR